MNNRQEHFAPGQPIGRQPHSRRFLRYLRQSWRSWLLISILVGGAGLIFLDLADEVFERERLMWDAPVMLAVHQFSTPWLDKLMLVITWFGYSGAVVVAAATVLWLWWRSARAEAVALLVSFVGAAMLDGWLKMLFTRPRPNVFTPVIALYSYSFPSGHAMNSMGLYGFIAYLLWRQGQRVWAVLSLLFALLIAFSRIYLGVHYPSDIIGALAISTVWMALVIGGYNAYCKWRSVRVR